ncbi:MAG TPA: hypothetical protein VN605_12175 [Thermoanaerobaculia bacterium]|nr:hypothetical protein [Thermoanaerobaculia bacterium]
MEVVLLSARLSSRRRSSGVTNVVAITISATALYKPALSSFAVRPTCAKIRPTSPRGIIPTPMTRFLSPGFKAT